MLRCTKNQSPAFEKYARYRGLIINLFQLIFIQFLWKQSVEFRVFRSLCALRRQGIASRTGSVFGSGGDYIPGSDWPGSFNECSEVLGL